MAKIGKREEKKTSPYDDEYYLLSIFARRRANCDLVLADSTRSDTHLACIRSGRDVAWIKGREINRVDGPVLRRNPSGSCLCP